MSIKPIDLQVMIPRATEVAKANNEENQRNLSAQQQQASATKHKAEDSIKQVYAREQAQNTRIAQRQKENRQNDGKKKKEPGKNGQDQENSRSSLNKDIKTSTIDIKI